MAAAVPYPLAGRRIWVAGHGGLAGSAIARRLSAEGCTVTREPRPDTDLRRPTDVAAYLAQARPHAVVVAAGRVGGLLANSQRPADFLHDNLMIAANVIQGAAEAGVEKLLYLGSACLYPPDAPRPIREDALLSGPPEAHNRAYAVAKIAGIELCQAHRRQHGRDFIIAMPTNLYGPGDRFDAEHGHAPAALMRRLHDARTAGASEAVVWGSGAARRDFLHADDLAEACALMLARYSDLGPVNVASGRETTVAALAGIIARVVGFQGRLRFQADRPEGVSARPLDVSTIHALGWTARTPLEAGLARTYRWFLAHETGITATRP